MNTLEDRIFMMFMDGKSVDYIAWHLGITRYKVEDAIRKRKRGRVK